MKAEKERTDWSGCEGVSWRRPGGEVVHEADRPPPRDQPGSPQVAISQSITVNSIYAAEMIAVSAGVSTWDRWRRWRSSSGTPRSTSSPRRKRREKKLRRRHRAERRFRGKLVDVEVKNPDGICSGVKSLILNGHTLSGNLIPADMLLERNQVEVVLG